MNDQPTTPEPVSPAPHTEALRAYLRRTIGGDFERRLIAADLLDDDALSVLRVFEDVVPAIEREITSRHEAFVLMLADAKSERDERIAGLRADLDRARADAERVGRTASDLVEAAAQYKQNWHSARDANHRALETIATLKRALAGHLFDGESVSTREAIRNELIEQGFAAAQRAEALSRMLRCMARRVGHARAAVSEMINRHLHAVNVLRAECEELHASLRRARVSGDRTIPDDAVKRVALRMLRVRVYGTLPSERYDASALNQWNKVLEEEERETWREVARALLADLGLSTPAAAGRTAFCMVEINPPWTYSWEKCLSVLGEDGRCVRYGHEQPAAPQAPAEPTSMYERLIAGASEVNGVPQTPVAREDTAPPAWTGHDIDVTHQDDGWVTAECRTCGASIGESTEDTVEDWADAHRADTLRPSGPLAPITNEER